MSDKDSGEKIVQIVDLIGKMGPLELTLYLAIGRRIMLGQGVYGCVWKNKKKWEQERYEELLDHTFYAMMEMIERGYVSEATGKPTQPGGQTKAGEKAEVPSSE